jgi:anion-transporting  ArsA/GET3 family ATPase
VTGPGGPTPRGASDGEATVGELDELLASASVIVVVGPGGVGKTTVSAALAARAAGHLGRRALVVTVDPARRLADALGLDQLQDEPALIPVGDPATTGRLWAAMVDMARAWDRLVEQLSSNRRERDELLGNRLYRLLTRRFVQSHDYVALEQLIEATASGSYDLVVVDTPPSVHALDVLDAPARMIEFFDSRLLRWLTAPYRSRLASAAARPFLSVAERLLGGPFLTEIARFFFLFSRLRDPFVARARVVERRLGDPSTSYVVVTTPETGPAETATRLGAALVQRQHPPSLTVLNRSLAPEVVALLLDGPEPPPSLRPHLGSLVATAARQRRATAAVPGRVLPVPWRPGAVASLEDLLDLLGPAPAGRSGDAGPAR